jgi:predicted RNA-binding protein with PIN domain
MITDFLTVHYTEFGQTADTYIEKVCAGLRHQVAQCLVSRVIVATSDRAQQLVVQGYGAEWLSARQLCNQVEAKVCQMRNQHQSRKKSKGRFLSDSINDEARQKLIRLRMGL